jgi:hypothetical protein
MNTYTKEKCKKILLKECQIIIKEEKYIVTKQSSAMSQRKNRFPLKQSIIFHTSFLNSNVTFSERIYCLLYDINNKIKCYKKDCDNSPLFLSFSLGYGKYCSSKCSANNNETKELKKETCILKYGVDDYSKTKEFKIKYKKAWIKKSKKEIKKIISKRGKTCLKKWGVTNPSQSPIIIKKIADAHEELFGVRNVSQNKDIINKKKETSVKNYGVDNPSKSDIIKKKKEKTSLKHYGVKNPAQSESVKEKSKKTCMEKYGTPFYFQTEDKLLKTIETNLKKYGYESHTQNSEYQKNNVRTKWYDKEKTLYYQSKAEKKFIDLWTEFYPLSTIKRGPAILFQINEKGKYKNHYYHVDFEITYPDNSKYLVEIKESHYWYYKDLNNGNLLLKWDKTEEYCNNKGYKGFYFILDNIIQEKNSIFKDNFLLINSSDYENANNIRMV